MRRHRPAQTVAECAHRFSAQSPSTLHPSVCPGSACSRIHGVACITGELKGNRGRANQARRTAKPLPSTSETLRLHFQLRVGNPKTVSILVVGEGFLCSTSVRHSLVFVWAVPHLISYLGRHARTSKSRVSMLDEPPRDVTYWRPFSHHHRISLHHCTSSYSDRHTHCRLSTTVQPSA